MPKKKINRSRSPRGPRRLSVRSVMRREPDVTKIASTLAALAIAQAEKEAEASRKEAPHD
ncbi:hypothetical protein [Curtobacterium sp. B18]|uniref:hypothetical protein n=1 Tax=Curtobacterium sp. B18 TaxID=95614 RepID=UPI0011D1A544|nr:hypothetical protein [Curtobacterium sp. B18]